MMPDGLLELDVVEELLAATDNADAVADAVSAWIRQCFDC